MLKIIATMAAVFAVLIGVAIAAEENYVAAGPTDTPTETPAATASPTAAATATAAPSATAAPTGTAAAGTATPTRAATAAVTPAAVPGTGGEPGSSTNLLLILALGAGLVAGTAGLAGIAVTRRS